MISQTNISTQGIRILKQAHGMSEVSGLGQADRRAPCFLGDNRGGRPNDKF